MIIIVTIVIITIIISYYSLFYCCCLNWWLAGLLAGWLAGQWRGQKLIHASYTASMYLFNRILGTLVQNPFHSRYSCTEPVCPICSPRP